MKKVVIFGNSASGKSTLAEALSEAEHLAHLDLDDVAWMAASPPQRRPLADSRDDIERFLRSHPRWVVEGCYADLIELVMPAANEVIFLDLPIDKCMANAKRRPWEPHKYDSKQAQDANLDMLLEWIGQYCERTDNFSRQAHQALYDAFEGKKTVYKTNESSA